MEENVMEIRYKIFEKLKEIGITQTTFSKDLKMTGSTMQKFRTNGSTTLETIGKVCEYLQCPIEDIVEILYTNASEQQKKRTWSREGRVRKKNKWNPKKIDCLN